MRNLQAIPQKPDVFRFHSEFERFSIDTESLYNELGLDPQAMAAKEATLTMSCFYKLMQLAAEKSHRRFLGVAMGFSKMGQEVGVLGYILRNAPTFEALLELLHRYVSLVAPGSTTELLQEDDHCILTYKILDTPPQECCQSTEMTLAQFVVIIRNMLDEADWLPERVYLEHSSPSEEELAQLPLGQELVFDHFFSGITFPKELMSFSNPGGDPQLLALLEAQVLQTMEHQVNSDSLLNRVRLLVSSNLGNAEITADAIGAELGMSRSTLHRRLTEQGTTFNALKESVVLHVAKESLSKTKVSITELAQQLGYSDSSAFDRAFKRLVGKRPLEYRKQHSIR